MTLSVSIAASVYIGIVYLGYRLDVYAWNGGICRICGGRMNWFDTDSQGGRGYRCENDNWEPEKHPHRCVWISYPRVDMK